MAFLVVLQHEHDRLLAAELVVLDLEHIFYFLLQRTIAHVNLLQKLSKNCDLDVTIVVLRGPEEFVRQTEVFYVLFQNLGRSLLANFL
jgi:hypothetical protein